MVTQDYQQTVLERFMSDVTLKSRVKGINWNTTVFIALFHVGCGRRSLRVQLEGGVGSDLLKA